MFISHYFAILILAWATVSLNGCSFDIKENKAGIDDNKDNKVEIKDNAVESKDNKTKSPDLSDDAAVGRGEDHAPPTFTVLNGENSYSSVSFEFSIPTPNNYSKIDIFRVQGITPSVNCSGDAIKTITEIKPTLVVHDDLSSTTDYVRYSYRFCFKDKSDNLAHDLTSTGQFPSPKETVTVAGYHWYLGAPGQNCAERCSDRGGNLDATKEFAGGDGTVPGAKTENCKSILDAIWAPKKFNGEALTINHNLGCNFYNGGERYVGYFNTDSSSFDIGARRVCACGS